MILDCQGDLCAEYLESISLALELDLFDGVDIYGDESFELEQVHSEIFKSARRLGLTTKLHSGEQNPSDSSKMRVEFKQA